MNKKKGFTEDLIAGSFGLSIGSTIVGKLPASAASVGVQQGLGVAGGFFGPMVNVYMGGKVIKQLKGVKK